MKTSMFQIILLAVFGACAVAGTLIFALLVSGNAGSAIGKVVIWGTLDESTMTSVIRNAAEDDQRYSQVSYVYKDPDTYSSDLVNALAGGTGPDLFIMSQDMVMRDATKVYQVPFTALSKTQFQNTFVQAASAFMGENGIVALPLTADPLVMYWNTDLLSGAGLSQPPAYWDEVSAFAKRIVKRSDAGDVTRSAIAFGEYDNVNNAKDILSMLILQAGGTITARNSGTIVPLLSSRSADVQGLPAEKALMFYTEFADPSQQEYSWNRGRPDARTAFTSGDLALYFGYASEEEQIRHANPNLNFLIAPVPQERGMTPVSVARVYALATARTSSNVTGALTIATLLAAHDMSAMIADSLGAVSARRDALQSTSTAASGNGLIGDGLCSDSDVRICSVLLARSWIDPDPDKTNAIFRAMIQGVTSGSVRVQDALGRADQQIAHAVGQ